MDLSLGFLFCPIDLYFLRDQEATVELEGQEATVELDMEQQTGSKWEKEYIKAVYCHPAYLTSMQSSTS